MAHATGLSLEQKSFSSADETRRFEHGHMDICTVGEHAVGLATFEPGWKWSNDVRPIAQTKSCQAPHIGYVVSGKMHIVSDDGRTIDVQKGDAVFIAPGHDAWVVGDEPCVMFDVTSAPTYAKK